MTINRLTNFKSDELGSKSNKQNTIADNSFLKLQSDRTKPADIRLVLDDMDEIAKRNSLIDEVGAPQTNFASYGTGLANESSSTTNVGASVTPPRSNPLHDFEPVNYLISLSAISKDNFNSGGQGREILIARSGGKGPQGEGVLGKDYYIDNLVIRNTVSPTSEGKSGTVFQILFDVTEPYGTSFIDALITSANTLGFENHLKAVYKLKVEFKGVNDDGEPSGAPIDYATRIIPIHIYSVQMNVAAGVTTYSLQCVPATYLGVTELHSVTQEQITVTGDTVGQVVTDFMQKYNATLKTLKSENRIQNPDEYELSISESAKEIVESKIPYDANSRSANIINISNQFEGPPGYQGRREITVPANTSIQAFIEAVVRESNFYRLQFDANGDPKDDFLMTLRTNTRLEILQETGGGGGNRPVYKFIWVLRPQKVSASYVNKEAEDLVSNVIPVRTYNYLYTGQNKDILDFDVTYKFGYYQAIPYFKRTGTNTENDAYSGENPEETSNEDTTGQQGSGTSQVTTEAIRQRKDGFIADLNTENGEVATIFEQIIQDPSADLLVTQMEIIGDPCWIEQKSVLNESYQNSYLEGSPNIDRFGAVTTDEYEVYVKIQFKTPTDLNDETGLFNIDQAAFFSGIYKVYICESRFAGGMFTNVLQMVRMRHQPTDKEIFDNSKTKTFVVDSQDVQGGSKVNIDEILSNLDALEDNTTSNAIKSLNKTQKLAFDVLTSRNYILNPLSEEEALARVKQQFIDNRSADTRLQDRLGDN